MKPTGILICVPAFGQMVTSLTMQSLFNVAVRLTHPMGGVGYIPVSVATMAAAEIGELRNLFLTSWFDGPHKGIFSHLLFVDADMEFPVELILDMIKFNQPIMGCFYAKRALPAKAVGRCFNEDQSLDDVNEFGFMECQGVGGGVMMISRECVTKMIETLPEIIDKDVENHPGAEVMGGRLIRAFDPCISRINGQRLSEDLAFCERWAWCGGKVWASVNHIIGHYGPFNFSIRYADHLEKKSREKAEAA